MRFFNVAALASLATGLCVWRDDFKPNKCVDLTFKMTKTNSWVCKDCFNYRVEFNTQAVKIKWWFTNSDFLYMTFDRPVSFVTAAHPVNDVTFFDEDDQGRQRYRIGFKPDFFPGDNRIDFNIQFREDNLTSHAVALIVCPFCYPFPDYIEVYTPELIKDEVQKMKEIVTDLIPGGIPSLSDPKEATSSVVTKIDIVKFSGKIDKVLKFFEIDDVLVDSSFMCVQPYNETTYQSDGYNQWLFQNQDELERLSNSDELKDICDLVHLIEAGIEAMAQTYACLDMLPDRWQDKLDNKIAKISNGQGRECKRLYRRLEREQATN